MSMSGVVFWVQEVIGATPDGKFGAKSREALRAWQDARGLAPTGEVNRETFLALLATRPPSEKRGRVNSGLLREADLTHLSHVHSDLQKVVELAAKKSSIRLMVAEGIRSRQRQAELLKSGKSRTMNSRHLTGDAVDVWPVEEDGSIPWPEWSKDSGDEIKRKFALWWEVARAMFEAADELGVAIQWGNDWDIDGIPVPEDPDEDFADMPHWQKPWPHRLEAARQGARRRERARKVGNQERVL